MAAKKTTTKKSGPRKKATSKKAPGKTAKTKGPQAKRKKPAGKMSALDAAVKVLAEAKQAMTCREMIDAMATKGYWTRPAGRTPDQTLYSAIARQIATKGKDARFQKTERGKFAVND